MSDEAVSDAPVESAAAEEPKSERSFDGAAIRSGATADKPAGYHPVDPSTASPKEVQDRIDYLYRQVKDQSRHLGEYRTIAQQQSQQINELMSGVNTVVTHLHTKSVAESENDVRQKMQAAFEAGDTKAYLAEQEKLIDLKAQQRAQPQPKNQTQQQAFAGQPQSAAQIADQSDTLAPADKTYVSSWQEEKDERGNMIRPWAFDSSPDYRAALTETAAVINNPAFANKTLAEKLEEVDRRMGVKKSPGTQNVMGGGLTPRGKSSKIVLSPAQERIAVRTKFGARDGAKTDADYIAAYRKQIDSVQSKSKGGR